MDLYNAVIELRPSRLDLPLVKWCAAQLASFVFAMRGVPGDVDGVQIHIGVPGSSDHFVVQCAEHPGRGWSGYASPGCFPAAGDATYEVVATDAADNETFLGRGSIAILPRTAGNEIVATATDETGGAHTLTAVNLDGEWTLRVD